MVALCGPILSLEGCYVKNHCGFMLFRMSTKLNGVTPSQLPRDLKMQFQSLLGADSMEAYIRPGCVHLTLKYSVAAPHASASASACEKHVQEVRPPLLPLVAWSHCMG